MRISCVYKNTEVTHDDQILLQNPRMLMLEMVYHCKSSSPSKWTGLVSQRVTQGKPMRKTTKELLQNSLTLEEMSTNILSIQESLSNCPGDSYAH